MTIYSLYIFDRHCECVYYQDWKRVGPVRPSKNVLPGVMRQPFYTTQQSQPRPTSAQTTSTSSTVPAAGPEPTSHEPVSLARSLPFDEEAKLVYGVIFSLRNMIKKMAGREEPFTSYKTSAYKLHYYEVLTGFKFVLLSDPAIDSLGPLLKHIYQTAFQEYIVRNPLIQLDSQVSKRGIDCDAFRNAVDVAVSAHV